MSSLFQELGQTFSDLVLTGPLLIALPVAMVAGGLSFFSPCCLPLVPGYLSYAGGLAGAEIHTNAGGSRRRTILGGLLFVLGFAAVFTAYGALFGGLGGLLIGHQDQLIRVLGVVTILLGLLFTGVLARIPLASSLSGLSARLSYRPKVGLAGAPVLGVLFGIGWTPCIGPTLAAVLTLAVDSANASRGAVLAFSYSLGLGIPFLVAAFSLSTAMTKFDFARRHARTLMIAGGVLLIGLGVLQVSGLWNALIRAAQGWVGGYELLV